MAAAVKTTVAPTLDVWLNGSSVMLGGTFTNKVAFEKNPEAVALPNYDAIEVPGMR